MKAGAGHAFLRVVNVVRHFKSLGGVVSALNGVSFVVEAGRMVALMGKSGSGKTTLLNLIGGLDRADEGQIFLEGREIGACSEDELVLLRRERIGFVFQSFALLPTYSALENVELVLRLAGGEPGSNRRRAMQCLRAVGLGRRAASRPDELSGGQQQRVAIARAIAGRPGLILADEPTGELDSATTRQIFRLFRQLVDVEGMTVLLTSHNPLVREYADRVIALEDGRVKGQ